MTYLSLQHSQYSRPSYNQRSNNSKSKLTALVTKYLYVISIALGFGLGTYMFNAVVLPFSITRHTIVGYQANSIPFSQNVGSLNDPYKIVDFHDPSITATSYIVYDLNRNMILDSRNTNQKRAIASMTKLMSALVILDNYDLSSTITITQPITKVDRELGFQIGDSVGVNNLLNAMLVYSANDAAIIFANEYPNGGYTAFVKAMNDKAKSLGMTSTHFSNPSGYFDDNNYSTASDYLKLALVASGENRITKITSQLSYTLTFKSKQTGLNVTQTLISTDELLPHNQYVKGLKTGFTYASGECFASYWVKGKQKFLIIVMNSQDRFGEALRLFNESVSL